MSTRSFKSRTFLIRTKSTGVDRCHLLRYSLGIERKGERIVYKNLICNLQFLLYIEETTEDIEYATEYWPRSQNITIVSKLIVEVSIDRHGPPNNLIKGLKTGFLCHDKLWKFEMHILEALRKKELLSLKVDNNDHAGIR